MKWILITLLAMMTLTSGIASAVCEDPDIYPSEPTMLYCSNDTLVAVYEVSINDSINTTMCTKSIDTSCIHGCNNITSSCYSFADEAAVMPKAIPALFIIVGLIVMVILIRKGVIK